MVLNEAMNTSLWRAAQLSADYFLQFTLSKHIITVPVLNCLVIEPCSALHYPLSH